MSENLFVRARKWINTANPSLTDLAKAYRSMEKRIATGKELHVDDAEAAMDLIAETYEHNGGDINTFFTPNQDLPPQEADTGSTPIEPQKLDTSPLTPIGDPTPVTLSVDERRKILAELRATLQPAGRNHVHA